ATFAAPYAARVAAMDALLAGATPADWSRTIVEGWTLRELVGHLAATDSLLAVEVGAPPAGPPPVTSDVPARTAELIEYARGRSPEEMRAGWRGQAEAICARVAELDASTPVTLGGVAFPVGDHLLGRMLETWIHTDDAATVMGLGLPLPLAEHIHPVADFCARLLPWTMLLSGADGAGRAVRLVLTGPGGGSWHVPLDVGRVAVPDDGSPVDAEIACETVDLCFLLGGRRTPSDFPAGIRGDAALAAEVLAAAPALSGP
ncbi:maleylpyruvate isomerase family mycothiol-dependent enzyme, partial [Sphaerisporangium fuscum]|uniref:maleylpyruvate isomerase family mycothiol-dependent enzyme n=1 Tax=Sphaerisporangium fuscum TaxID=2835868 RepID=UPI001BDBE47F